MSENQLEHVTKYTIFLPLLIFHTYDIQIATAQVRPSSAQHDYV